MNARTLLKKFGQKTLLLIYILVIGCGFLIAEIIFNGSSFSVALHAVPLLIGFAIAIYSVQGKIVQSLQAKTSRIEAENAALEIKLKSSEPLDPYNAITGLPTVVFQEDRISMAIKWAQRKDWHVAVYRIQVGFYTSTKPELEDQSDNEVIAQKANRLKGVLTDGISLLHTGSRDFLILAESVSDLKEIARIRQQIEAALASPLILTSGSVAEVKDKLAVAVYPLDGADADSLLTVLENNLKKDCFMSDICRSKITQPKQPSGNKTALSK